MFKLAPSLLAADIWRLGEAVEEVVAAGAEVLHIDVMDGHFVPNLTMGPDLVAALRKHTRVELDVHLMVTNPASFIDSFARAGAHWISFHVEADPHADRTVHAIRDLGCKAGIALNPATPVRILEDLLEIVDFVLLMSVNPGFGGQNFISRSYRRLDQLVNLISLAKNKPFIQVDGGIDHTNIAELRRLGMAVAVAGSSVFRAHSPADAVRKLISLTEDVHAH